MMYVAKDPDLPGYIAFCVDNPAFKCWTARDISRWIKAGYQVTLVEDEAAMAGIRECREAMRRRAAEKSA